MGVIIDLAAHRERRACQAETRRRSSGPCEIIVLPCVRYERSGGDGGKPTSHGKKGRKRKARSR